jgi:predicted nucleic acid-binding protein
MGWRSVGVAGGTGRLMILVDTTVWIDLFKGQDTTEVRHLERLVGRDEDLCICGVILTEVLQGIREDREYDAVSTRFEALIYLPMAQRSFKKAAEMYRSLRRKGVTIRNAADCMIAAVAIEHDIPLLHNDRDFAPIAHHCGLKVIDTDNPPTNKSSVRLRRR